LNVATSTVPAKPSIGGSAATSFSLRRTSLGVWFIVLLAFLLPVMSNATGLISNFTFLQLSLIIVYTIAILGLNILIGFNGQISLGHGAFFAIGAYTAAILIDRWDCPYLVTFPVAALICLIAGYLFGLPALRLEGHYLALATFALAIAIPQMLKYRHLEVVTNGVQGINLVKPEAPFGLPLSADKWMYLVSLMVALPLFWVARNLTQSRIGRAMMAIRDHEMAASAMGVNSAHIKSITFGISALYTGVAGALHAIIFEYVSPDSFRLELSITLLVGAVVGGIASLSGAVIGGTFVHFIDKYADALTKKISANIYLPIELEPWTIYGIALIAVIYVMPNGIAGGVSALWSRLRHRG
jgi:branched-chain amino acid transport system permease protein